MIISSLIPEKKIFKGFELIWHGCHIGHVTKLILINFYYLVPKNSHINLVTDGLAFSMKNKFFIFISE